MTLSYEFFNNGSDVLFYDATMTDDVNRIIKQYNEISGLDYLYVDQATGYFQLYKVTEYNEVIMLFVTNDHNWFVEYIRNKVM